MESSFTLSAEVKTDTCSKKSAILNICLQLHRGNSSKSKGTLKKSNAHIPDLGKIYSTPCIQHAITIVMYRHAKYFKKSKSNTYIH